MGKMIFGIILLMASVLPSCYLKSTKNSFRRTQYCFDEKNTGLDQRIKLDGYYELTNVFTGRRFFKVKGEPKLQSEDSKTKQKIKFAFYPNGIAMLNLANYNPIRGTASRYIVVGDTLKSLSVSPPFAQTLIYESFRIVNDSTLEYLGFSYDKELDAEKMKMFKEGDPNKVYNLGTYTHARFVPYDSLPPIDNLWIKRLKWFWCDKEQYKAWKKHRKR